jgi:phospholipid/cholesterol/gamma-HCH transport system substrate-binding protein
MFGEVREAARSIRILDDNLDKRTADITTGINRFTGSGLREVETLTTDGRRTLNDISRAVRSLERNPQQLIFGGKPNLPEYSGRR